ncbi:MAG: hypothetical protein CMJ18_03210 [Phycisphaeraceae bacterium]|nr:hypothetical protein [Phycisphaeraceae bacterium]
MGAFGDKRYGRIWRPVTIADSYRYSVTWSRRNEALDQLDDESYDHQSAAAASALGRKVRDGELQTRPQRGPLHIAGYPDFPAARACLGLSAIAEFKAHAGTISATLAQAAVPAPQDREGVDATSVEQTLQFVCEAIANRLCIDQLVRFVGLGAVESYRLFAASIIDLRFTRLRDVILAAATLGDLVSGLVRRPAIASRMHPLTVRILEALEQPCRAYALAVDDCDREALPDKGAELARSMMAALMPFLPLQADASDTQTPAPIEMPDDLRNLVPQIDRIPRRRRAAPEADADALSRRVEGTDQPAPPAIDEPGPWRVGDAASGPGSPEGGSKQSQGSDPQPSLHDFLKSLEEGNGKGASPAGPQRRESNRSTAGGAASTDERITPRQPGTPDDEQIQRTLRHVSLTIAQATGQSRWDDPRADQVALSLSRSLFEPGTVEADLVARRRKVAAYGSEMEGHVKEQVLSRCRDRQALSQVRDGAEPIERKLRSSRWYGQRRAARPERLQSGGLLDPRRLYRLATSPLLYRRWRQRQVMDFRGRPVVVLAKDGSSSNTIATTFAGKILAAAFLKIERYARIRAFAADYASDGDGPLVRWLYHPQMTPGRDARAAADAVASLPPKGQGANEDVLSISHIMTRVLESPLAQGQTIILLNITDGKFNSPIKAYQSMVSSLKADYRVVFSLVVLGDHPVEVPEADYIVRVPKRELDQPGQVADRIADHVNALVRRLRGDARMSDV